MKLRIKLTIILCVSLTAFSLCGTPVKTLLAALAADGLIIEITSPTEGQAFKENSLTVTGLTDQSVSVRLYLDGTLTGEKVSNSDGTWTFFLTDLGEGEHNLYAVAADGAGNTGTSGAVNFLVDTIPPVVNITSPVQDTYTNLPGLQGVTEPEIDVTVFVYGKEATVQSDLLGYWFFYDETLPEGNHTAYARAVDKAGNEGTSATISFLLDTTRPVIMPDLLPRSNTTQVPTDTVARVYMVEQSPVDIESLNSAIILLEKINPVYETVYDSVYGIVYAAIYDAGDETTANAVYGTVYSAVYNTVYGDQYYELTFVPGQPLKPYTKYTVTINPEIKDAAGNYVYPRKWDFQTDGDTIDQNPHGNYTNNVNTCVNCHETHRAPNVKLVSSPTDSPSTIDDYCLACHDGTVAPVPENWQSPLAHSYQMSISGTIGPSACTSCHNPHLTITRENPNLLRDYYLYNHNDPTNPYIPDSTEEALCEYCHEASIKDDPRVVYKRYYYENWHTSTGANEDYNLCLRCHDGGNASDIAAFYNNPSRHQLQAEDGSFLKGNLPCAECHNAHGSGNLKLISGTLGHNKARTFQSQGEAWDASNERRFCRSCHNNETELYGIVAGFVYDIPGHEETSSEFCSTCHGGSTIAAAHGPQ